MAGSSSWHTIPVNASTTDEVYVIRESMSPEGYTIDVSNLVQVWTESLDRLGVIRRADEVECCIEPTQPDQFMILLDYVSNALHNRSGTEIKLTRKGSGLELKLSSELPEPLPKLQWSCFLDPLRADSLKNHVIMPLLGSIHVLKRQVDQLSHLLHDKDRAINRIMEKIDSNRIDISSIFPIQSSKASLVRQREVINERVQGMRPFEKDSWLASVESASDTALSYWDVLSEGFSKSGSKRIKDIVDSIQERSTRARPRASPISGRLNEKAQNPERVQGQTSKPQYQAQGFTSGKAREQAAENMKKEKNPKIVHDMELDEDATTTDGESDGERIQYSVSSRVQHDEQRNSEQPAVESPRAASDISTASSTSSASSERQAGVIGGQVPIRYTESTQPSGDVTQNQSWNRPRETGYTNFSNSQDDAKQNELVVSLTDKTNTEKQDMLLNHTKMVASNETVSKTEDKGEIPAEKKAEDRREELKRQLEQKSQMQTTKRKRRF